MQHHRDRRSREAGCIDAERHVHRDTENRPPSGGPINPLVSNSSTTDEGLEVGVLTVDLNESNLNSSNIYSS